MALTLKPIYVSFFSSWDSKLLGRQLPSLTWSSANHLTIAYNGAGINLEEVIPVAIAEDGERRWESSEIIAPQKPRFYGLFPPRVRHFNLESFPLVVLSAFHQSSCHLVSLPIVEFANFLKSILWSCFYVFRNNKPGHFRRSWEPLHFPGSLVLLNPSLPCAGAPSTHHWHLAHRPRQVCLLQGDPHLSVWKLSKICLNKLQLVPSL